MILVIGIAFLEFHLRGIHVRWPVFEAVLSYLGQRLVVGRQMMQGSFQLRVSFQLRYFRAGDTYFASFLAFIAHSCGKRVIYSKGHPGGRKIRSLYSSNERLS